MGFADFLSEFFVLSLEAVYCLGRFAEYLAGIFIKLLSTFCHMVFPLKGFYSFALIFQSRLKLSRIPSQCFPRRKKRGFR